MRKLAILSVTIILVSSIATIVLAENKGPAEVKYTPKMGTITFNHSAHQERADCASCHHTVDYAACKSCHGVDESAPSAKNAFHQTCKGCHTELKQGPSKCKECHVK